MRRSLPLALALLVACQSRLCVDPTVRGPAVYEAPKLAAPPTIDGALDDAAWNDVPWTEEFLRSNVRATARHKTRAKLAWDDRFLYLAFEAEDDEILTPFDADDSNMYESEVVELFVDADGNQRTYDEIELNPRDRLFDARFPARRQRMDLPWASGTRHAVKVDGTVNDASDVDRGWTAELAVPIGNLSAVPHVPPLPGDRWRINLYRLDHGRGFVEGLAWSPPLVGDFHALDKFGTLVFAGPR